MPLEPHVGAVTISPPAAFSSSYGKSVGIDKSAAAQAFGIAGGVHVVAYGLAPHSEAAGQHAFGFYAALDGCFHHAPYLGKVVPYVGILVCVDVFPVAPSAVLAPFEDVLNLCERIDAFAGSAGLAFFHDVTSAYAVICACACEVSVGVECAERHAVGVERKDGVRLP